MGQIKNKSLLKKTAAVLKELRVVHNLTQEDVYNDTSIHVGRIEAHKVNLSISTLSALCNYYDISVSDFFKRVESI